MRRPLALLTVLALGACAQPRYVEKGADAEGPGWNQVAYRVHEAYRTAPPDCVAVMPLAIRADADPRPGGDDLAKVRLSLWAHLATQSKRLVRLERVDHLLAEAKGDRKAVAERLKCAAVLEGEVTEFGRTFLGVYSRTAVGADLKLVRPQDGAVLWEGAHVAASHGGALPLDPVGVAMAIFNAFDNAVDEQVLRATDDLARRLVSTIPDEPAKAVAMDDPVQAPAAATAAARPDDLGEAEAMLAKGDHAGALAAAERAVAANPDRPDGWFMKGRVLMLEHDWQQAEPAILKAVALDRNNPRLLNALGAVSAERGRLERALAAYRMAIDAEPANGFAWYNTGVIHLRADQPGEAADAFYGAGLAYLKAKDWARVERSLAELAELAKAGLTLDAEIATLKTGLAAATKS